MLKFLSECSCFGPIVSASGYGNYKLYTHGYGSSYVGPGTRRVSCSHYITYVSYLNGYHRKTVGCMSKRVLLGGRTPTDRKVNGRISRTSLGGRGMSATQHKFFAISTLVTTDITMGTRRGGISNNLTPLVSGGIPGHTAPVIPTKTLDFHRFTRRYATYRLYISIYPGRMLHPSNSLGRLVRPRVSCRHKCYHPRYTGYTRMYPASTVRLTSLARGSSMRVNRTI